MEKEIKCKVLEKFKEKKRLTPTELAFISAVAKETLKFLARNNIPLIPENYLLWFEIFCYIMENNLKLSDLEIIGLFKTKYPTDESIEKVLVGVDPKEKETIKRVVESIAQEIDSLISTLEIHQESLEEKEKTVKEAKNNIEDKTLKGILSGIVEELQFIRKQNEELKKKLEESNSQIKRLSEELERTRKQASVDFLTQVANRASFDRALSDMVKDFYRRNYPFALLMIDIDHFKKINDTYGHQAGDYVLRELAKLIKEQLRARDIIARYGGEEFVVILPGVTFGQAVNIAERIRKSVEKHLFRWWDKTIPVTISIGVAVMRDGLDEFSIVEKADKALYLAKKSGRNQVKTDLDVEISE